MIGWYVHAHGAGHRTRLAAVAEHLRTPVTALSSAAPPAAFPGSWLPLPEDLPRGHEQDVTAGGTLHWAPLHHPGLRERMASVAAWVCAARPALVVVDVSVEIAVLVRSLGVPVVLMAMRGERQDRPHVLAQDLADSLLAPWPAALAEPWTPALLARTHHLGALSRFDALATAPPPGTGRVAVLWGSGGSEVSLRDVEAAADATPGWSWSIAGVPGSAPVLDVWALLQDADVVVTHGGQNAVAEVAAARRPAVVVPQARPFGEQVATGRALERGRLAEVVPRWPDAAAWPELLARTAERDGARWSAWSDGHGAPRAAALLDARVQELTCASR